MIAGPAQAYICRSCIEAAGNITGMSRPAAPGRPVAPPAPIRAPGAEPGSGTELIEAAVALSRALGWSLSEVRSLTPAERAKAMELVSKPKPKPKPRKQK
jgi:hypothetical protein